MSNALTLSDGGRTGSLVLAPQSFSEVVQFAELMSKCSFVPKHLRNRPADCMAVCMQALRWEMDPFSVAQKTYFVSEGAAPGYEAQLISAVVHSRAPLDGRLSVTWTGEGSGLSCTVTGKFRGDPTPKAKTCRIANIKVKNSPLWAADPEQQLAYYTTRAWARLYCPDIIMGVYTHEELSEVADPAVGPEEAKDVTPPASRLDKLDATIVGHAAETPDHVGSEFALPPIDEPRLATPEGEVLSADKDGLARWAKEWRAQFDRIDLEPADVMAALVKQAAEAKVVFSDLPETVTWIALFVEKCKGRVAA